MRIREATVDDAARLAYVSYTSRRTTYQGLLPDSMLEHISMEERIARWKTLLQENDSARFCYVAEEENGEIVGFASGGPSRDDKNVYPGELYTLYLLQEAQKKGYGRRLVAEVAQRLHDQGFPTMIVHVLATNPACGFYERLGGQLLERGTWEVGDLSFPDVCYGWPDIRTLLAEKE